MNASIPTQWETLRLHVTSSGEADAIELQKIYDETSYISQWTGFRSLKKDPMLSELRHENLPPGGIADRHIVQSARLRESNELVGFAVLYLGFPNATTVWIANFAIRPAFQKQGFGRELVLGLSETSKGLSYQNLSLSVPERNRPAVDFWNAIGFKQIAKIAGPQKSASDTGPTLWLSKRV